jgi:hypothetical protein
MTMNALARARARCLFPALLGLALTAACGDSDGGRRGAAAGGAGAGDTQGSAPGGEAGATGDDGGHAGLSTAGKAGSGGSAGESTAGKPGRGASAGESASGCTGDDDCEPLGECYSAACSDGLCVGAALARGSECSDGYCNGFGRCLACINDAPGVEKDKGCSARSPLCAETDAEPACVECEGDRDCDDGSECTTDRCAGAECENAVRPLGSTCSAGFCTGAAGADSCVSCIDDSATGRDTGCTAELPKCDEGASPPACSACQEAADCDDGNPCTEDRCSAGACENATLVSGTPCPFGYCNGVAGAEFCVQMPCQTDADCDDHADCTTEVCEANSCTYTTNDSLCPDTGDPCHPNVCTVGTGCQGIDKTRRVELLENGHLDAGHVSWVEASENYPQVIYEYDYVPALLPHTPVFVAWLGGGEGTLDDRNSLSQVVGVPAGTVDLTLTFFYQIWTDEVPDSQNQMR